MTATISVGTPVRGVGSRYQRFAIEHALRECPLFAGIRSDDLAPLVDIAWLKSAEKGEHFFYQGTESHGVYIMQSGAVRLYRVNVKGQEQVVHVARPSESFGEEALFSETGHVLSATSIQTSRVVVLPKNGLMAVLRASPELLLRMVRALSCHFREVVGHMEDLRLMSTRARLAKWMLHQCPHPELDQPQRITLSIPKRELASELGMASETFSRALADFQAEQLLDVQGRTLVLLSPRRLEEVAEREECHFQAA